MVTITKDNHTIVVTKGAYNGVYKPQGYTIVKNEKKVATNAEPKAETHTEIKHEKIEKQEMMTKGK